MRKRIRFYLISTALLALVGILAGVLVPGNQATSASDPSVAALPSGDQATELASQASGEVVIRLYYEDQAHLNAIANELDIWEVKTKESYALAAVSSASLSWLEALGYRVEIDQERTEKMGIQAPLDPRFYYFDTDYVNPNGLYIVDFLQETNAAYPALTELIDIGDAWQASHGGHIRDMWVLRITNEDPAYGDIADKPPFFMMGTIHAREVAVPELAIRYIKYLTGGWNNEGGYGLDADATWLVNHNVIYMLVMQNPDGHRVNEADTGAYRRKNMDNDDGCPYADSWGIDLNRNHSFLWGCCGGSSGSPCDETYRGPLRGSEPETEAFEDYFATVIPDQNGPNGDDEVPPAAPADTTGIFISLHSYSDLVLWPWGLDGYPLPGNYQEMTDIGRKFAYFNGYDPAGNIGYEVDGSTDIWTYGKFGVPSYTFEVGSGGVCGDFFPAYGCIDGIDGMPRNFWAENKPAFILAHKLARTPYMTIYGPDTLDVFATPGVIGPGEPTDLTATVIDRRLSGDPLVPITAAEYFINAPGADGTGTPMDPVDGTWGGTTEEVVAAVDTSSLGQGQHYLLVHGRNSNGDWGPFSAVFLYVMEPGVAPVIQGTVRDAGTNAPLAAQVTAGVFQADTDPVTGIYTMTVISGTYDISAIAPSHAISTVTGVEAFDYETVTQDFYLMAICEAFSDDVENGNQGWVPENPWAITTEMSHSPTHSWTDSPGGNYGNNINVEIKSPVIDLSEYSNVSLSFWHTYALESGYDYGYVEYSDDGVTWFEAATYNGNRGWEQAEIALPGLDGIATARIRFRLTSDYSYTLDGWHIDDILITGSSDNCNPLLPPSAEFSSNSPVYLGEAIQFTDLSSGTPPLYYAWDFGDGVGSSTEQNPAYTYASVDVFTVTLTVTNTEGTDSVSHPVEVLPPVCVEISALDATLVTTGTIDVGELVEYSVDLAPEDASKPYTYTVDYGDGTPPELGSSSLDPLLLTHTYAEAGVFEAEFGALNCAMLQPVTDTLSVGVEAPIASVDLTLVTTDTLYAGQSADFSADLTPEGATKPYSYTVDFGDGSPLMDGSSSDDPLAFAHAFASAGSYPVSIEVWNESMPAPVTDTVAVEVQPVYWLFLPATLRMTELPPAGMQADLERAAVPGWAEVKKL